MQLTINKCVPYRTSQEVIICEIDKNESENFRIWWPFFRDRRIDSYDTILKRFNLD